MQIRADETLEPASDEWDALADRAGAAPWLRPGWVAAWTRAFGRGRLEVLTARRDGRLVAVLPLERRLAILTSPSNWHTPAFGLVADDAEAARALARAALARRARRVALAFVSDELTLREWRRAAEDAGQRLIVRPLERSPYVLVDGDWAGYERRRDGKLLRELRRRRRRLAERGALALEVADGRARLDELLDEGFRVEAEAWKGRAGTAILSDAATAGFYRDVARWAAERGCLRLAFLRLDDRPVAFDFCIEENGVHSLLKTGYDPAYRAFAPGMLMRRDMLARAFANGLTRYDFLGADEPWKLVWAEAAVERRLLQAFARSPAGMVDWAAWAFGRPLARRALAWRRR